MKKPVYAIFVDFKKAFDSVCRQALFYKLVKLGITGKFYSVLRDMFSNSFAYIKLAGYLSKKINITKGTDQGHRLTPFHLTYLKFSCMIYQTCLKTMTVHNYLTCLSAISYGLMT